jgi:uncharacterized protein YbjQ (UPF0145 family)
MARCERCNVNLGFGHLGHYCAKCTAPNTIKTSVDSGQQMLVDGETKAQVNAIMLTTETAPNLNITKRIEIVTAECAFGMNMFKDLFAGVRDIVGGRSEAVQKTMRDSRKTALHELKREAFEVGANAVVGVDLDYVELSNVGSMVMLVASGTAVIIEDKI